MTSNIANRAGAVSRRRRMQALLCVGVLTPAILMAAGAGTAQASQLTASQFTAYNPANAGAITPGPTALYTVDVDSIHPTQQNEGLTEVGKKAAGFDLDAASGNLTNDLLTDIEPVVIGPGGVLYLTDGHHTFTALLDSTFGASDPTVYVNVIANYSNLSMAAFTATMEANNFLLPLNDGVPSTVNPSTLAPIPGSLTALTSDPYRGLEYSILKNKSSALFPNASNITGKAGSSIPGLDKMTGFYSDFLEADAYRNANGGLGLPYLSPGDIAIATNWNLNPASATTLPNISGTVTAAQLPGFILSQNIANAGGISNSTLANGALDGNGTFTGITSLNVGTVAEPITIGTPNVGLILQLGNDSGHTVTLSGTNTYTGGTSILAGRLIIASDAALGAATANGGAIDPANVKTSVQADNGTVFNSLTEGNGTLTFGTNTKTNPGAFSTSRPIAVGGEVATIDVNANTVTLTGQLASLGVNGVGIGNATGESDLTIDDLSGATVPGKLILATDSPLFFGNLIIGNTGSPVVAISDDGELGNANSASGPVGQVELNGGTLQTTAAISASERNLFLGGGSQIDTDGVTSSWGTITNIQRTLTIQNTAGPTSTGSITFNAMDIGATSILALAPTGGNNITATFTNGIVRTGADTLILNPTAGALGGADKVFSGGASAVLTNTIAPAWIVVSTASGGAGPYDFATYGSNGYVAATYNANTTTLDGTTTAEVVKLSANATLAGDASVYALNTAGKNVTEAGHTLTIGDGTHPAGLILGSGSSLSTISGGALAFGASQGVIWLGNTGSNTSTISSTITGSGGLIFAGSGGVNLSAQENLTGAITIDSGTVNLTGVDVFKTDAAGILMDNTKSKPAAATLTISANNQVSSIVQVGNNATITIKSGAILTVGDTTNNESSVFMGKITDTTVTAGALTLDGSGLFDFSAGKSGLFALASGSSIIVNNAAQFRVAANEFVAGTTIVLNGTSQLQLAENGGQILANTVTGSGELHLIGGTLQITGTANAYLGGTVVETGSTLDITTNNLPAGNPNITDAGGLILFDQNFNGTYAGVISDGHEMGTGPLLSGSLDKDDSTDANGSGAGALILSQAQAFTGETYIEAGTITLNPVDTLAASSGVDLGRVGGGSVATLALGANNTIKALTSEAANTTSVTVGANTLTINSPTGGVALFGGSVTGSGSLVMEGAGVQGFSGSVNLGSASVTSGTLVLTGGGSLQVTGLTVSGGELDVSSGSLQAATATISGGTFQLDSGTATVGGLTISSGDLNVLGGTFADTTTAIQGGTTQLNAGTFNGGQVTMSNGAVYVQGGAFNAGDLAQSGGTLELISGSITATSTELSGGTLEVDAGSMSAGPLSVSGGGLLVDGGALSGSTAGVSGGELQVTSGSATFTGATTVSAGTLDITGGSYSSVGLSVTGGQVDVDGGTFGAGATTLSGGGVLVDGGAFSGSTNGVSGGLFQVTSGSATFTGATSVTSGGLDVAGGDYATNGLGISGGKSFADGGTLEAGAVTVSAGSLVVDGGALSGSTNGVSGGVFGVSSGSATFTGATTVSGGQLQVDGGDYHTSGLGVTGGLALVDGGTLEAATASVSGKGGIEVQSGAATISGATTLTGGDLLVDGGSYSTNGLGLSAGAAQLTSGTLAAGAVMVSSSGVVLVDGGTFSAGTVALSGNGDFGIDGGAATVSGATTLTGGGLVVSGGSYTTNGLSDDGVVFAVSGTLNAGAVTTSGGFVLVDGGAFNASSATLTSGGIETASGAATISGATTITGGVIIELGGSYTTNGLSVSGAGVEMSGGAFSAGATTISGGEVQVNGGTFAASSNTIDGGEFDITAGAATISGLTTVSSGSLSVDGGTYTTGGLSVAGGDVLVDGGGLVTSSLALNSGEVEVSSGSLNGGAVTLSGGLLKVDGGAFSDTSLTLAGGALDITSGSVTIGALTLTTGTFDATGGTLNIGAATVDGGSLLVSGGTVNATTFAVDNGSVQVSGGTLSGGATTVAGGTVLVDGGAFDATSVALSGGVFEITSGAATVSGTTTVSGGVLDIDGGTFTTKALDVSGGGVDVAGGDLEATTIDVTGGQLELDSGTIDPLTVTVSSGTFLVAGGTFTAAALDVSGGLADLIGGIVDATDIDLTGGTLAAAGSKITATDVSIGGGFWQQTGGAALTGTTEVSGGTMVVGGGSYMSGSTAISGGLVGVTGGTLNAGATTITGGRLVVKSGAFNATSTTVNGGVVDVEAHNAFTSPTLTIGPNGTFEAPGGSGTAGIGTLNNSGLLDIRNGAANNVFTVGAYTGAGSGQLAINANLGQGAADRLVVAGAAGATQLVVVPVTGAGPALPFNPNGIPVVVSASAMSAGAFTLAAPVQGGLFQYDLALNAGANEFVLIGAPTADAFRLASLPTAAQSIWFDTTDSWQDHESDLRGASGITPAAGTTGAPGVWARAVGDWSSRTQSQTYTDFNKSYAFQTGYNQTTGGFFGGVDKDARVGDGEFIGGFGGGYITSNQNFKGSTTRVTYQGPSIEVSAAYLVHGFFLDGAFKADFLSMSISAPSLAAFGNGRPTTNENSYGATGDAGYRFSFGPGFVETIASLSYVETDVKGFHLAGTYDSFGDNEQMRGRLGISGGATLHQDTSSVIEGAVTGSYWDRLSGGSQATIASGAGAPLLNVTDPQVRHYGEVGASISVISLKTGWSGFLKGDYQFANGFTGGDVKAGIRLRF